MKDFIKALHHMEKGPEFTVKFKGSAIYRIKDGELEINYGDGWDIGSFPENIFAYVIEELHTPQPLMSALGLKDKENESNG